MAGTTEDNGQVYCQQCRCYFPDSKAIQQHWRDSPCHEIHDCPQCDQFFPAAVNRDIHLKSHNVCDKHGCTAAFITREALQFHIESVHAKCPFEGCFLELADHQLEDHLYFKQFCCRKCNKYYASQNELDGHKKSSNRHFWCPVCRVDFISPSMLDTHYQTRHFWCNKCSKEFPDRASLISHYSLPATWAEGCKHFYCITCYKDFDNLDALRDHYWVSNRHHYCIVCNQGFKSAEEFVSHTKYRPTLHSWCPQCEIALKNDDELEQHIKQRPAAHPYCFQCKIHFSSFDLLKSHKKNAQDHHYCNECDLDFPSVETKELHMATFHYRCSLCDQTFWTKAGLQTHKALSVYHRYCPVCQYEFEEFEEAEALTLHREFNHHCCRKCDKRFEDAETLIRHIQSNHHYCWFCREHFSTKEALGAHKAERHCCHYCDLCEGEFPSKERYEMHVQTAHAANEDSMKVAGIGVALTRPRLKTGETRCPVCPKKFPSLAAMTKHWEAEDCSILSYNFYKILKSKDQYALWTTPSTLYSKFKSPGPEELEKHWSNSTFMFNCPLCDKDFQDKAKLGEHLDGPDHQPRRFRCPHPNCDVPFITFGELLDHLDTTDCSYSLIADDGYKLGFLKGHFD